MGYVTCRAELYASFGDVAISGNQSDDWDSDLCDPDAQLSLVERLEKYVDAEHVYSRYEYCCVFIRSELTIIVMNEWL